MAKYRYIECGKISITNSVHELKNIFYSEKRNPILHFSTLPLVNYLCEQCKVEFSNREMKRPMLAYCSSESTVALWINVAFYIYGSWCRGYLVLWEAVNLRNVIIYKHVIVYMKAITLLDYSMPFSWEALIYIRCCCDLVE